VPATRTLVIGLLLLVLALAVVPNPDPVGRVDAVVVLGGGAGERLDLGLELAADRRLPLVLTGDAVAEGSQRGLPCDHHAEHQDTEVVVLCAPADPATTAGEARAVAALADASGFQRLAVVTTSFHVDRARTLFAQCLGADAIDVTGAVAPTGFGQELYRRARELVARVAAVTLARAC
jgi:uncharacterized SAM-binding protein YcdF (DUF218 family)